MYTNTSKKGIECKKSIPSLPENSPLFPLFDTIRYLRKLNKSVASNLNTLEHFFNMDPQPDEDSVSELKNFLRNLLISTDKLDIKARDFVMRCTPFEPNFAMEQSSLNFNIEAEYDKEKRIFHINILGICRKKNDSNQRAQIDPIFYTVKKTVEESGFSERYKTATIIYKHCFPPSGLPWAKGSRWDYDNLELKKIQDIIATFLLVDDCADAVDIVHQKVDSDDFRIDITVFPGRIEDVTFAGAGT